MFALNINTRAANSRISRTANNYAKKMFIDSAHVDVLIRCEPAGPDTSTAVCLHDYIITP